jgi:hypothetical protein
MTSMDTRAAASGIYCRHCGYDLRAQPAPHRCPECGREFDPANRKTFRPRPPRGALWRSAKRASGAFLALAFIVLSGMWLRSYWYADGYGWRCGLGIGSERGRISIVRIDPVERDYTWWPGHYSRRLESLWWPIVDPPVTRYGFAYWEGKIFRRSASYKQEYSGNYDLSAGRVIFVPYWFVLVMLTCIGWLSSSIRKRTRIIVCQLLGKTVNY